jgi:hypothetical protein
MIARHVPRIAAPPLPQSAAVLRATLSDVPQSRLPALRRIDNSNSRRQSSQPGSTSAAGGGSKSDELLSG